MRCDVCVCFSSFPFSNNLNATLEVPFYLASDSGGLRERNFFSIKYRKQWKFSWNQVIHLSSSCTYTTCFSVIWHIQMANGIWCIIYDVNVYKSQWKKNSGSQGLSEKKKRRRMTLMIYCFNFFRILWWIQQFRRYDIWYTPHSDCSSKSNWKG